MRAATHEKHVQEPVPVDVSNPRVDVSNLRAPMFPALRRKTTVQILILILPETIPIPAMCGRGVSELS